MMQRNWTDSSLYTVADWVMKLAYLNLLWILFTFLGLLIFGFMPATIAMFTIVRKLVMNEECGNMFKTFASIFKKEWIKSNTIGLILLVVGYILYLDFLYLGTIEGMVHSVLSVGLIVISICYLAITVMIFPVYVHFKLPFKQYFKHAFLISIINPHIMIFVAAGITGTYYLFNFVPGLTLFFCGSLLAAFIMWSAILGFNRVEKKQQKHGKRDMLVS